LLSLTKTEFLIAVPDNGKIEVEVIGQLKTSQEFFGTDTVKIKPKPKTQNSPSNKPIVLLISQKDYVTPINLKLKTKNYPMSPP